MSVQGAGSVGLSLSLSDQHGWYLSSSLDVSTRERGFPSVTALPHF